MASQEMEVDSQVLLLPDDSHDVALETPAENVFCAPSINAEQILAGKSYSHHSPIPVSVKSDMAKECVLGIDEAGRGPVLGPMVYGLFYLPLELHHSLLADTHHFDDSKVLTPQVRSSLMETLCTDTSDLFEHCGWATRVMSARDISAGMMRPTGTYNLNAQAMDATIDLVKTVLAQGVNVTEIYIDTIGKPEIYQRKLERIFPTQKITVAKKADSLYPCVSAASVCAKVTRDAALEVSYKSYEDGTSAQGWGSGYPSDARCTSWLKQNMDPVFGWGAECRFSWSTAKELLEVKNKNLRVDWPEEDEGDDMKISAFFAGNTGNQQEGDVMRNWFGRRVAGTAF